LIGKKGPEKTGMRLENQLMSRRTITKSGVAITLSSGQSREKKKEFQKSPEVFLFKLLFCTFFRAFSIVQFLLFKIGYIDRPFMCTHDCIKV